MRVQPRLSVRLLMLLSAVLTLAIVVACFGQTTGDGTRPEAAVQPDAAPVPPQEGGPSEPTAVAPSASLGESVGRGSAGPDSREVQAPRSNDVVDTGGLPTVVFVDADG